MKYDYYKKKGYQHGSLRVRSQFTFIPIVIENRKGVETRWLERVYILEEHRHYKSVPLHSEVKLVQRDGAYPAWIPIKFVSEAEYLLYLKQDEKLLAKLKELQTEYAYGNTKIPETRESLPPPRPEDHISAVYGAPNPSFTIPMPEPPEPYYVQETFSSTHYKSYGKREEQEHVSVQGI